MATQVLSVGSVGAHRLHSVAFVWHTPCCGKYALEGLRIGDELLEAVPSHAVYLEAPL